MALIHMGIGLQIYVYSQMCLLYSSVFICAVTFTKSPFIFNCLSTKSRGLVYPLFLHSGLLYLTS